MAVSPENTGQDIEESPLDEGATGLANDASYKTLVWNLPFIGPITPERFTAFEKAVQKMNEEVVKLESAKGLSPEQLAGAFAVVMELKTRLLITREY